MGSPPRPAIEHVAKTSTFIAGHRHNVGIFVFGGALSVESLKTATDARAELRRRTIGRYGVLTILKESLTVPASGMHEAATRATIRSEEQITCSAIVLLGNGFWASGIRTMLAPLFAAAPAQSPRQVFLDVGHAVLWVRSYLATSPTWPIDVLEAAQAVIACVP
jgi:hypothetical protein